MLLQVLTNHCYEICASMYDDIRGRSSVESKIYSFAMIRA